MIIVLQNDIQNMSTRTESINVRVTPELKELAQELARAKGMTLAAYIVHLINVDQMNSQKIISREKIEAN